MESRSGNVNRAPSKVVIKAPGKAFRAGISLIELFETFPDNATAEAVVHGAALAGRQADLPALRP